MKYSLILLASVFFTLHIGNSYCRHLNTLSYMADTSLNPQNEEYTTTLYNGHFVKGGVHDVSDFGLLFEGNGIPDSLKQVNTTTIQMVLDSVGFYGGGTVIIPLGIYCLTTEAGGSCLHIKYDNIILRGAGMGKTKISTFSEWDSIKKARAAGIRIHGTDNINKPRKNITMQDFELDGGAGWTGKYDWRNNLPDEWDITHKGIITALDDFVDNITLKNLYVHRYRGEILYSGGMLAGKVVVKNCKIADTNGSCFNLYGAQLLVDSTEFSGPSRFWAELTARANQAGYPYNQVSFTNCVFKDAVGAQGITICQGDNTPISFTFSHNTFSDAPRGVFLFAGGIGGPVNITDNRIFNCGGDTTKDSGDIIDFEWGGNTGNPKDNHWVKNITFANNWVERCGNFISLKGSWDGKPMVIENMYIYNNVFSGKDSSSPCSTQSIIYGESVSWWDKSLNNCQMSNITIYNNVFKDCAIPAQIGKVLGTRPMFARNKYINICKSVLNNLYLNKNHPLISPKYDEVAVYTTENMLVAQMDTANYPNNQYVKITGGTAKNKIKFVTQANTYQVKKEVILNGKGELWLRFDSTQGKWIETRNRDN